MSDFNATSGPQLTTDVLFNSVEPKNITEVLDLLYLQVFKFCCWTSGWVILMPLVAPQLTTDVQFNSVELVSWGQNA